jgi:hypothetical protein
LLHLNPQYHVIEGHTLLPDHEDSGLFYAIPPAPVLALTPEGTPAFSLVQFLGGGTGTRRLEGGLLNLSVELHIPDETLQRLQARLKSKLKAPGSVRVTPVLFDDGVVELVAVGASSGAPAPASADSSAGSETRTPPPSGSFEVKFLGSGRPSLGGNNISTFQLVLDAPAAELLERTLEIADLPIIAIYRMGFAGLRPSFQIDIQADWHKLYKNLENKFRLNLYYVSADAEIKVADALETSGIRIDTSVFGVGPGAQASAERARKQLTDWVFERLFVPMIDQTAATANAVGQVIDDTVSSLVRAVIPGVSYRLRMMEENQLRMLSVRMNETVAERREVVPQGTLGGLLQRFRLNGDGSPNPAWPALRDKLVQKINLEGFPRLEVKVAVEDRFATDGLSQVGVELRRLNAAGSPTNQKSLMFRSASEREEFIVNLLGDGDPRLSAPYEYRYTVHFDPTSRFGFHEPLTAPWQKARTTELFVEPRSAETYTVRTVQVGLVPTFSFSQFAAVTVELRAGRENTSEFQSTRVLLTQEKPQSEWRYRNFGSTSATYEYRATFHRPADRGGDIQGSWTGQAEEWLSIPDPLPRKRIFNIIVNLPWPELLAAFVQIRYMDPPHGIHYDEQIDLNSSTVFLRRDIPIAENGPRAISYRLTILFRDGKLMEGSWRETEDERLLLDRRVVESRVIRLRTVGGTLRDNRLSQVRIRLQAREPGREAVRNETEMRIRSDNSDQAFAPWEYLIGDPPIRVVHYDALFVDENGFTDVTTWRPTEADLIVVNLRTKTTTA